jgi:hypothetical protein
LPAAPDVRPPGQDQGGSEDEGAGLDSENLLEQIRQAIGTGECHELPALLEQLGEDRSEAETIVHYWEASGLQEEQQKKALKDAINRLKDAKLRTTLLEELVEGGGRDTEGEEKAV